MRKTEMWKKILLSMVSIYLISFLGNPFIKSALAEERHGHRAHHEGVLNVIGKELGHVEILLQGDTLEAWFVGGGEDTARSVPIAAAEIPLTVTFPGTKQKKLTLKADPMKLAGERMGHCSHFVAQADWLKDLKEFEARGEVILKGIRQKLVIQYPEGYDPGHKKKPH
jgi:hypothetical protein